MSFPASKRVIRAKLYDALSAAVTQLGGFGSGAFYEEGIPVCLIGFLHFIGVVGKDKDVGPTFGDSYRLFETDVANAVKRLFRLDYGANDNAINTLRKLHGITGRGRVPFGAWAAYLNVQRAVEVPAKLYDQLRRKSELNGGIGYGCGYEHNDSFPCCVGDYAAQVDGYSQLGKACMAGSTTVKILERLLGYSFGTVNDQAVVTINSRKGTPRTQRVSFQELADELNLIRVVQLPAKVYDALKATADKFGGIGAGHFYAGHEPLCARGLCWEAQGIGKRGAYYGSDEGGRPLEDTLEKALGGHSIAGPSDAAVQAINARKGTSPNARVSFEEWAQELNIDRVLELPAKVYDALKKSAEENGGIGGGANFDDGSLFGTHNTGARPFCALGHAMALDGGTFGPTASALDAITGSRAITTSNDGAVRAINKRKGQPENARVSFAEWASELGVVRGDA